MRLRTDPTWFASLAVLFLATAVVFGQRIDEIGRSEYYAAIARSMSISWRNFVFGAFDPAGLVSVDKVPGSFWFTALSVRIFGFSDWSLIMPNVVATAGTAVTVAVIGRRWLGRVAGLAAGAAFALTPIVAAVARSNQPHVIFVFFLVLAAERATAALQTGSRRSLIAAGLWIAMAFHCYMLEAWALWPALIAAWMLAAPVPMRRRVRDLLVAGVTSGVASFAWIAVVALTPASSRPWVGGSNGNSGFEMVFGYNGIGRFASTAPTAPASGGGLGAATSVDTGIRGFAAPFGGPPGLGRLFNMTVGNQVSWLMPAAIVAVVVLGWIALARRRDASLRSVGIFLALWFVIYGLAFSLSQGIHQFYTAAMAPAVALLAVAAIAIPLRGDVAWGKWIAVGAVAVTVWWADELSGRTNGYMATALDVQVIAGVIAVVVLWSQWSQRFRSVLVATVAVGMLLTPAAWAIDVVGKSNPTNPVAGPAGAIRGGSLGIPPQLPGGGAPGGMGPGGMGPDDTSEADASVAYLLANAGDARFLVGTFGALDAAPFITATGRPVVPMGGFDGKDLVPTFEQLRRWVDGGDLRFLFIRRGSALAGGGDDARAITGWVRSHCVQDPAAPVAEIFRCTAAEV